MVQKIIVKIEEETIFNETYSPRIFLDVFEIFIKINFEIIKFPLFFLITIVILIIVLDIFYRDNIIDLKSFKKYIYDCKHLIKYERNKIDNKNSYIEHGKFH